MLVQQDFWRKILCGAAKGIGELACLEVGFRQAEVTQRNMSGSIKKDILRFEIPKKRDSFVFSNFSSQQNNTCLGVGRVTPQRRRAKKRKRDHMTSFDHLPIHDVVLVQMF